MATSAIDLPKPARHSATVGFGPDRCETVEALRAPYERLRRRRQQLEAMFSPLMSPAALPSAVDRLVLWRSHHGRHHLA